MDTFSMENLEFLPVHLAKSQGGRIALGSVPDMH